MWKYSYGRKVNNQAIEETDRKGCFYPPAQMDRDPSPAWPESRVDHFVLLQHCVQDSASIFLFI